VPIKLSRRPPQEWAAAFPQAWDSPPEFTTMHRPGIASVSGDCIILDGTTVEEVRDYHARTLTLVVARLNVAQRQLERDAQAEAQRAAEQRSTHADNVRSVVDDIRFQ
jgi:hypothetical protein